MNCLKQTEGRVSSPLLNYTFTISGLSADFVIRAELEGLSEHGTPPHLHVIGLVWASVKLFTQATSFVAGQGLREAIDSRISEICISEVIQQFLEPIENLPLCEERDERPTRQNV